jgi:RimJ/RimL family protein N-acetyltransferase
LTWWSWTCCAASGRLRRGREVQTMPLEGKLVILREEQREDLDFLRALRNDLETQAWSKTLPPDYTEVMLAKRFEAREFSFDPELGKFIILDKETGERAGSISYSDLERRFAATLGVMMAKKFWGTGLAFVFVDLGVRVARIWTHSGNPRAIELAKKSGFQVSGRLREAVYKNGRLLDSIIADLLREEYFARHPELEDGLPPL